MSTILSLAPQNVWKHFYSLTQIPRPSGHMEKVTEFLINFGKGLGLESFVDEAGNVIIRKSATPGMENRKGVILQAHMDMVPQKNNDTVHDFEKDPIETYIDGDWVKAKGTYEGILPAADCEGIRTALTLNNDNTYVLRSEYIGEKDAIFESKGSYHFINGRLMELAQSSSNEKSYYKILDGSKVMLSDKEGTVNQGVLAEYYILKKK